ncbi:MAG: DUF167 domain-containing protein [Chloroflexi bacterium]|nr:DUF167 domain-containing protein [Chloroflexota bacterium]
MASARLTVRVQPGARRNEVTGYGAGVLHLRVTAPPLEGRANDALRRYVADLLGIRRRNVAIRTGLKGRSKVLEIDGLDQGQLDERLRGEVRQLLA